MKIPAYLTGYSSRSDNSVGIRFATQEVMPEEVSELQKLNGAFGWLLFQENSFTDKDLPKEQAEDKNKTPSKRLRSVLYIFWQQQGSKGDFEVFYRDRMEKLIEMIKGKLDNI